MTILVPSTLQACHEGADIGGILYHITQFWDGGIVEQSLLAISAGYCWQGRWCDTWTTDIKAGNATRTLDVLTLSPSLNQCVLAPGYAGMVSMECVSIWILTPSPSSTLSTLSMPHWRAACVPYLISINKLRLPNLHVHIKPKGGWIGSVACAIIITRINGLGLANLRAANNSQGMKSKVARGTNHMKEIFHQSVSPWAHCAWWCLLSLQERECVRTLDMLWQECGAGSHAQWQPRQPQARGREWPYCCHLGSPRSKLKTKIRL